MTLRQTRKCAFCHNEAVAKGGEHLWDDWINKELPKKTRFNARRSIADSEPIQFVTVGLKEKLPAVCPRCNNGWMSALTGRMKERFSETILNDVPFSLGPKDAVLLATFTFMKATVTDYYYGDESFFLRDARKRLKMSFTIPPSTRMWLAAFQGSARYSFYTNFYRVFPNTPGPLYGMEWFCYTYILGNLTLQLLAPRWKNISDWNRPLVALTPNPFWQSAAIRFWPYLGEVHWPPAKYLGDSTIEHFINRFDAPINPPV